MGTPAARTAEEREQLLCCLRRWSPITKHRGSDVVDEVLGAYGDLPVAAICRLVQNYATSHSTELAALLDRQKHDRRRPSLLSDPALICILERLEHDRYALRRNWTPAHDPRELRRIADLWGVRV
jgi:hypothetical protein